MVGESSGWEARLFRLELRLFLLHELGQVTFSVPVFPHPYNGNIVLRSASLDCFVDKIRSYV